MSAEKTTTLWYKKLHTELQKPYFLALKEFVKQEREKYTVYPKDEEVFNAIKLTSFEHVKVVLLGQDPYHGPNQAHGLSFSVKPGVKAPPSLVNIFKELNTDLHIPIANHGNLTAWAERGILLLNATLTVRAGEPGSHQKKGWEQFTDAVIKLVSDEKEHCVFLLWGNYARTKAALIDQTKHLVLEAAHPSPLARGAFFGSKPFSKTNNYLISKGKAPINWDLN